MSAHHWQLDPTPASAGEARRHLRSLGLNHHVCRRSELLVTELVANVVRHADVGDEDPIELAVRDVPGGRLHVEVIDRGHGFDPDEVQQESSPLEGGGWGLRLLERLSDDWGVLRADDRTCVWFEVTL